MERPGVERPEMAWQTLRLRRRATVLTVQIHRPEADNGIDGELTWELGEALRLAEAEPEIKVVVLEGGAEVFCSGLDFRTLAGPPPTAASLRRDAEAYYDLLRQMVSCSKVVVALVEGKVNAGGVGLVAASDQVFAGPGATFALSELLFGLLPACVLPFLARRVGLQRAQLLALTTQPIDVGEAHRWGLVDECGDAPRQLLERALPRLGRLTPAAIGRLKGYGEQLWVLRDATRELAVSTIAERLGDPEVQRGIRRFVEEGVFPWQR